MHPDVRPACQTPDPAPWTADPAPRRAPAPAPRSAMAIAGFVLGIVALLTSFVPIVNNASFALGLLGVAFAVAGLVAAVRGTRSGKGLAIAALVLGIASVALVLATQSLYGAALDAASEAVERQLEGPAATGTLDGSAAATAAGDSGAAAASATDGPASQAGYMDLAVGMAVQLANGLSVSVDAVQAGLMDYDGSFVTGVQVTYANGGSEDVGFGSYDWDGQDAQGVQRGTVLFLGDYDVEALGVGTLAPGGTVTGMLYFGDGLAKVLYSASVFGGTTASWQVA